MLSVAGIPPASSVFANENIRREILNNDETIVHEYGRHDGTLHSRHIRRKCRGRRHHSLVGAVGHVACLGWLARAILLYGASVLPVERGDGLIIPRNGGARGIPCRCNEYSNAQGRNEQSWIPPVWNPLAASFDAI